MSHIVWEERFLTFIRGIPLIWIDVLYSNEGSLEVCGLKVDNIHLMSVVMRGGIIANH